MRSAVLCVVMLIIALAGIFAWSGTMLGTFRHLAEWIISLTDNGVLLLIQDLLRVRTQPWD